MEFPIIQITVTIMAACTMLSCLCCTVCAVYILFFLKRCHYASEVKPKSDTVKSEMQEELDKEYEESETKKALDAIKAINAFMLGENEDEQRDSSPL